MLRPACSLLLLLALQLPAAAAERKVRITTEDNKTTVHAGDILRISAYPSMPKLRAKLVNGKGNIGWWLSAEYDRRSKEDDIRLPSKGTDRLDAQKWWLPRMQSTRGFFGGKIRFHAKEGDKTYETSFKLYGRNPKDADAKRYIKSRPGSPWFAYAIARHESRQGSRVYNQFNTTDSRENEPVNRGESWGMFMIRSANTEETWNWKENVKAGVKELEKTKREGQAYFNAIRRNFPLSYVDPPDYRPPEPRLS